MSETSENKTEVPAPRPSDPEVTFDDKPQDAAAIEAAAATPGDRIVEVEPGPGEPPPVPTAKDASPEPIAVTGNLPARAWPPKQVADLMTRKVITVQEDEPIGDLEAWMDRFRFRHLPVVGAGNKLVGLITKTDFLHARVGYSPEGKPIDPISPATKASAIMRRNVVTARVDSPLTDACRVMLHEKMGCLPVILEDTTLVGIVTESDFARLALEILSRQP
jgi:CBS domain-containing protein